MWKKELRSLILPVLIRLSLLVVPFVFAAVRWFTHGTLPSLRGMLMSELIIFWVSVLWVANHLGIQTFRAEFRDKAFEYFLSLPFTRPRLLAFKLVPRLAVLAILVTIYEVCLFMLNPTGEKLIDIVHPVYYPIWVLLIFFFGFLLSFLESPNTRALGNFVIFFYFFMIDIGMITLMSKLEIGLGNGIDAVPFMASGALILLIMGTAFFRIALKFDLRAPTCFARSYLRAVFIPLTVLALAGLVFFTSNVVITPA